jgi:hypothetical protein
MMLTTPMSPTYLNRLICPDAPGDFRRFQAKAKLPGDKGVTNTRNPLILFPHRFRLRAPSLQNQALINPSLLFIIFH